MTEGQKMPVAFDDNGVAYDSETNARLTECCNAYPTYSDLDLVCRKCYGLVSDDVLGSITVNGKRV